MSRDLVPPLDLYLAGTMRMTDDLMLRLIRYGIKKGDLDSARSAAESVAMGDPRRTTVDLVIAHFGVPSTAFPDRLVYDLTLWPEHRFEWQLSDWGGATFDGFLLKEQDGPNGWATIEISILSRLFKLHYHTIHEVRANLGEPDLDLSWGFLGEWYFGPGPTGDEVCFQFDYGLLHAISSTSGVIVRHKGTV